MEDYMDMEDNEEAYMLEEANNYIMDEPDDFAINDFADGMNDKKAAVISNFSDGMNDKKAAVVTTTDEFFNQKSALEFKALRRSYEKKTPSRLAQDLSTLREYTLKEMNSSAKTLNNNFKFDSQLVTEKACFTKAKDAPEYLSARPTMNENPVTCVLENGSKYFLRHREVGNNEDDLTVPSKAKLGRKHGLLSVDIEELIQMAEHRQVHSLYESKQQETESSTKTPLSSLSYSHSPSSRSATDTASALWVDKYAPKTFTQLLSSEKINREVVKVMKSWDPFVFSRSVTSTVSGGGPKWLKKGSDSSTVTPNHTSIKDDMMDEEGDEDNNNGEDWRAMVASDTKALLRRQGTGLSSTKGKSKHGVVDSRPMYKVILLAGPPGTGKTTLAHIVAKHCGYQTIEINASDERTTERLQRRLKDAMQSHTLLQASALENTPNCVILDEIDGIDNKHTIDALCTIIQTPLSNVTANAGTDPRDEGGEEDSTSVKAAKTTKKINKNSSTVFPLTRPLICICNDLYAPSLRELKKLSMVFVFAAPSEMRLLSRLKHVCAQENKALKAHMSLVDSQVPVSFELSTSQLTALCQATGNDIRASLNTLQFIAAHSSEAKNSDKSRAEVLQSMIQGGLKDETKNVYQIWNCLFSKKTALERIKQRLPPSVVVMAAPTDSRFPGRREQSTKSIPTPVQDLISNIQDYGDLDLVLSGAHENFPSIPCVDPNLHRMESVTNWLSLADGCVGAGYRTDGMFGVANNLIPVILSAVHLLWSVDTRVKISWPSKDRDAYYQTQHRLHIYQQLVDRTVTATTVTSLGDVNASHVSPHCLASVRIIALDVLDPLKAIIHPRVRPLPYLTMTASEQYDVLDTVKVMVSIGLKYVAPKVNNTVHFTPATTNTSMVLEPNILEVCYDVSGGTRDANEQASTMSPSYKAMTAELSQVLFLELRKYILHGFKDVTAAPADPATPTVIPVVEPPTPAVIPVVEPPTPAVAKVPHPSRVHSFFSTKKRDAGAPTSSSELAAVKKQKQEADVSRPKESNIKFKFNKGFSNAVRRPVNIREFL